MAMIAETLATVRKLDLYFRSQEPQPYRPGRSAGVPVFVEGTIQEAGAPLTMKAGESVGPALRAEIAKRFSEGYTDPQRSRIAQRYDILQDKLRPHVARRLTDQYESDVVRHGTASQITSALNPGSDIVERVCQVYRHGVRRSVVGVSQKKSKALSRLYRESHANAIGRDWNRYGYFLGPTHVVPRVRSKKLRLDTILPHRVVPILDEENPTDWPLAIAYRSGSNVVIVEATRTTTYQLSGSTLKPTGSVLPSSAGSKGVSPFAGLRFDTPLDPEDWLSSGQHQRIVDGTLDVAVIAAVMGFVRRTQNKKLLTLQGYLDGLIKGQSLGDPEKPIVLPTPSGSTNTIALSSLDFDTDPKNFLGHIRFWYGALADSTGVPAVIHSDGASVDLEFAYDGLNELREEQVSYVEEFERDLCVAMVVAAVDGGHPVADSLPTVEEIQEGFRIQFGKMSRKLADPVQEQAALDWEMRHGMISVLDLLAKMYPGMDVETLRKLLEDNLEENARFWDEIAKRNGVPGDQPNGKPLEPGASVDASGKVTTAAQANGASGPKVRDAGRTKPTGKPAGDASGGRRSGAARKAGGRGKEAQGRRVQGKGARARKALR